MPRGSIATAHLRAIRSGNTQNTITLLEFDVDNGLIFGHDVLNHPLRNLWGPLWGIQVYPQYEDYATRLANFRKQHPSLMRPDTFDKVPDDRPELRDFYADLAKGARESIAKRDLMIQRYATK